ncbi:Histidine kinase [Rhodovastum atsumiense]|uniref:histidine kinase n=1 Tax=Rhodovastum atsumiense TaxID=504468 RepID=A0A5M6ILW5_9PROT|nr:ATP-binding protein [Rhodovastum atsumiense]KAA5609192.1 hybrid sensor histidine kinase/response regulator [Rhodovastum atsumiense]CAH2602804.1 Histidine kinase [Rhodovastum atsumiense]
MARTRKSTAGVQDWLRWALLACVGVPLLLFAGAAWFDRDRLLDQAHENTQRTTAMLREHALKAIETSDLLVRQLDLRTRAMSWEEIRAQSGLLSVEMQAMHASLPQISALALSDAQGRQWAVSVPLGTGSNGYNLVTGREFWSAQQDADRGTFISRAFIGNQTKRRNFGISRRRAAPDDSFNGTVHAAVGVAYFTDFWKEAVGGNAGASVTLVRDDGEILARHPEPASPLPRLAAPDSSLMRHLATQSQAGVYRARSSIDGTDRIHAYARLGRYPLVVVHGTAVATVQATWMQHVVVLGSVCALAAFALAFLVLLAMRQNRHLTREQAHRAAAETSARQSQRMELLGQLTAGVAHDVSNVVQAVIAGAELIEKSQDPERMRSLARMVCQAGERGQVLTRRMLDFARRDGADGDDGTAVTDPAEAVGGISELMSRTLGQAHRLRCEIERQGLPTLVRGGRGGLEVGLMNLAANARDAMPAGGEIVIRLAPERVAGRHPARLVPGLYVRVSVADTGEGMPPKVLARAGEAFFTTKPRGKGTGLGLSSVRGFAESAGGALRIESEPGRGTTVTFWLPAAAEDTREDPASNVLPLRAR